MVVAMMIGVVAVVVEVLVGALEEWTLCQTLY